MNEEAKNEKLILIVDDNVANLQLAVSILKKQNFEIIVAESGYEAFSIMEEVTPDLILLDIMMPELDGFEVCEKIKAKEDFKDIPILFLTALKRSESLVQAFECGGVDYITKPFKREELISRVKNHLELKESRDIIINQKNKLEKLNEEKNGILRITAHDLKNPLQGIQGMIEIMELLLEKDDINKDQIRDLTDSAKKATQKANKIINDILHIRALEEGRFELQEKEFSVLNQLEEIVRSFKSRAQKKNITIYWEPAENDHIIKSDPEKFSRIFENLISNAVKFSEKNSNVFVRTYNNKENIRIEVEDQGPGFSTEDRKKIFEKFAKLSARPTDNESSSGLGLSIVKKLCSYLGIDINFETEQGKGTKFILTKHK